jgi:hypothetical protein
MWRAFRELDRILRGEATRMSALRGGTIEVPAGGLAAVGAVLAMAYGVCMGCFGLFKEGGPQASQAVASAVKVPALFFLTLVVTFPSLYVSNALVGSRLSVGAMLRLLVASLGVMIAVLASLGPIVAFFSAVTTSYAFMVLLNVAVFALSGVLGLGFLLQTLHRLSVVQRTLPPEHVADANEPIGEEKGDTPAISVPGALEPMEGQVLGRHVKLVFRCWVVLFGLVGAQMAWVLRPFFGSPGRPFAWFRPRESNFFEAVLRALIDLF